MKPFFVLIITTVLALLTLKLTTKTYNSPLAARIGMAIMLLFTALGHFMFTKGMALMVPDYIPFKRGVVYATAILEILGAIGLLIPQLKIFTGWCLIMFFILVLPANIKAAIAHIDYQKGTVGNGAGLTYLLFRIPLQVFFIIWVYISAIK